MANIQKLLEGLSEEELDLATKILNERAKELRGDPQLAIEKFGNEYKNLPFNPQVSITIFGDAVALVCRLAYDDGFGVEEVTKAKFQSYGEIWGYKFLVFFFPIYHFCHSSDV